MSLLGILISALGGAGLMYLLDPQHGKQRRELARDQLEKLSNQATQASKTIREQAQDRAEGVMAEAKSRMEQEAVSDETLVARVRSEMGHLINAASAVEVLSSNGLVTLSGYISEDEADKLVSFVKQIRGVKSVENQLSSEPSAQQSADFSSTL